MPLYDFDCDKHGRFEIFTRMGGSPDVAPCPGHRAGRACSVKRVFSAPAAVQIKQTWNDKANAYQRDPYTQARAQLTNVARTEAERGGGSPRAPTEASVQAAARAIDEQRRGPPKKSVVQRQVELQRKLTRKARASGR